MNKARVMVIVLVLCLVLTVSPQTLADTVVMTSSDSVRQDVQGTFPSAVLEEGDRLIDENAILRLYANETTKLFKVQYKSNGFIFSNGRDDAATESLSRKWKAFAMSPCTVDYITVSNMNILSENPDLENMQLEVTGTSLAFHVPFVQSGIKLNIYVALDGASLTVYVPDNEIVIENADVRLHRLTVLPFLGAAFVGEGEGYVFMPDGAGALIRFDAPTSTRALTLRAFGADRSLMAIGSKLDQTAAMPVKSVEHAFLPVLGMAYGKEQSAFVLWAEEGEPYCDLMASPAGNNNLTCYYACIQAVFTESYQQPASGGDAFTMVQPVSNRIDLRLRYTFLAGEEATYVGMANAYRNYLERQGLIQPTRQSGGHHIAVLIDCLMEESVKAMIGTSVQVMTRFEDVKAWAKTLIDADVKNIVLALEGTAHGGVSRSDYDDMRLDSALGSEKTLQEISELGAKVILQRPYLKFYGSQLPSNRRSYAITRRFITMPETLYLDKESYFLPVPFVTKLAEKALETPLDGMASDDLGCYLFSGYQLPDDYTREDAMETIADALKTLNGTGIVALGQPGVYALQYTDMAYDVPMSHSAMIYETDVVPFVQIVYSGSVQAFTRSQVAGNCSERTLLRMIDFNLYPHYTLTEEPTSLLAHSNSSNFFSTQASELLSGAIEEYAYVDSILGPVAGQRIIARRVPQDGVSIVTYESGARIIVNYNEESCEAEGYTVPGLSAMLVEGGAAQ